MTRLLPWYFLLSSSSALPLCKGFLGPSTVIVANSRPLPLLLQASTTCLQSNADDSIGDSTEASSSGRSSAAVENDESTGPAAADPPKYVEAIPMLSSVTDPEAIRLREELLELAEETNKGFTSTPSQKKRAREIIFDLARFNPTQDPAAPYYAQNLSSNTTRSTALSSSESSAVSLAGKWDLIFTDAPDITSLDTSRNPLATAKLGRIGQECVPPFIKNVIEWRRPDWADQVPLPFVGSKKSRILQKVCTKATASPEKPMLVDLEVVGIDLVAPPPDNNSNNNYNNGSSSLQDDIERDGLLEGLLRNNPLELRGPVTAPFGQFEILYLDEEMRIIRTGQNFVAVNLRAQEEWF